MEGLHAGAVGPAELDQGLSDAVVGVRRGVNRVTDPYSGAKAADSVPGAQDLDSAHAQPEGEILQVLPAVEDGVLQESPVVRRANVGDVVVVVTAGPHQESWNGRDNDDISVTHGINQQLFHLKDSILEVFWGQCGLPFHVVNPVLAAFCRGEATVIRAGKEEAGAEELEDNQTVLRFVHHRHLEPLEHRGDISFDCSPGRHDDFLHYEAPLPDEGVPGPVGVAGADNDNPVLAMGRVHHLPIEDWASVQP